jgi:CheY-like chemotaxis protein
VDKSVHRLLYNVINKFIRIFGGTRFQSIDMPPKFSLMLVDDDADDQLIFMEALKNIGVAFSIQTARDGVDALDIVNSVGFQLPDIAFFDLNMPRMNGKELLTTLRNNPKFEQVPIIIFSTSSRPEDINDCIRLGANAYLTKHGSFSYLCNDLKDVLNNHLIEVK